MVTRAPDVDAAKDAEGSDGSAAPDQADTFGGNQGTDDGIAQDEAVETREAALNDETLDAAAAPADSSLTAEIKGAISRAVDRVLGYFSPQDSDI